MKRALITGITGMDGSHLADYLLAEGYEVHGIIRRASNFNTNRIEHIFDKVQLHYGDVTDTAALGRVLRKVVPGEVYNLAAQSHVKVSFELPHYTGAVTGLGVTAMLEAVREFHEHSRAEIRMYQASSSEMFGNEPSPQSETTRLMPVSPYGAAKVYGHHMARLYRESYGLHINCGILFNHEGPRRGETFVTRKITRAAGRIKVGLQSELLLGNIFGSRDWGHAKDYVRAMHLMLQQDEPDDYVIATGETHTVQEFCELAFGYLDLKWGDYVTSSAKYQRPNELHLLHGNPTKAREKLGWVPEYTFSSLVEEMVRHDYDLAVREQ